MPDSDAEFEHSGLIPHGVEPDQSVLDTALLKVARGSVLILLGMALARICGFLRQFLVIRMLSPKYYGQFALALTIINVLVAIGALGLYHGSQRFISYNIAKEDYPRVKGTIQSSIRIVAGAGLLLAILTMVFADTLAGFFSKPDLKNLLMIMAPLVPFNVIALMIAAYFLGMHKPGPSIYIGDIGFGLVSVIAVLVSLLIARSQYSPAIAMSVSFFLVFLASVYIFKARWPLDLRTTRAFPITKILLLFSIPLFMSDSLYLVMGNADTVVIGYYLPSNQLGYYNAAFLLMTLIPIFLGAVSLIYMPVATGLRAKRAQAESLGLYQSCTRWLFILTLPMFLTFFLLPAQTLSLLFGEKYSAAATSLWILSLGAFVNTFLGPNNFALIAYGETRMVLYGSLSAAALDVVLNLLLVPLMGITGAALATAAALGVSNIMYSSTLWARHRLHPFERIYIRTVLFLSATGLALYIPLRAAINRAGWLLLAVYPLFLILGLLFIILTRSITEEDRLLWQRVKDRFGN